MSEQSDLYFSQHTAGQMANLVYMVGSSETREALIVDPAWNVDALLDKAEEEGIELVGVLCTHCHPDHVGGRVMGFDIEGVEQLLQRKPVPVHISALEADGLRLMTGIGDDVIVPHEDGDVIELGSVSIRLIHTPGHSPGSQCLLVETQGEPPHLISGDTLFIGSVGRVDLPGGDPAALYHSLHSVLKALPDETRVFPGHLSSAEGCSTMEEQKRSNPFLRVESLEMFLSFMGA